MSSSNLRDAEPVDGDELDLRELFANIWRGRGTILLVCFVVTGFGIAYALLAESIYRAEALVEIREESKAGGGLKALAGQFGALADIAGLSAPSGGQRSIAIATVKSHELIEDFIQSNNLLPKLFPRDWDDSAKQWKTGSSPLHHSLLKGYEVISKEILKVAEDKKSGLVTVAVEWDNPAEAPVWVTDLIARANRKLKQRSIDESERNLAYLQGQALKTSIVELQKAIYSLMEVELKKEMVAKNGEDFALRIIDSPVVPERRIRPMRALVIAFSLVLGAVVGITLVLIRAKFSTRI